jgi:(p)ppGpp synthase/HD superfamily hydrolase
MTEVELAHYTEIAVILAKRAHKGQFRNDGVTPYYTHPYEVAERVVTKLKPAAYLHDVLEDTNITEEELRSIFPDEIVDVVVILTRRSSVSYDDYMKRVLTNPDAITIKLADIDHNFNSNPSQHAIEKMNRWKPILERALTEIVS